MCGNPAVRHDPGREPARLPDPGAAAAWGRRSAGADARDHGGRGPCGRAHSPEEGRPELDPDLQAGHPARQGDCESSRAQGYLASELLARYSSLRFELACLSLSRPPHLDVIGGSFATFCSSFSRSVYFCESFIAKLVN